MTEDILYLNADAVRALGIAPDAARESVVAVFRDYAQGRNRFLPKAFLDLGPGHGFQSMPSASEPDGIAVIKWVSMAPVGPGSKLAGINATICISDYASGVLVAVLDGNEITLVRTAAHHRDGGCGLQASAHLAAFVALFPSLERLLTISRSRSSAERLSGEGRHSKMEAQVADSWDEVLAESDIIIPMVPNAPGLVPFLDARKTKPEVFVSAVDIGRSWIPESFAAFDVLATDSPLQSRYPYDVHGKSVETASFDTDLVELCGGRRMERAGRQLFCFRGLGLGDHALAHLAFTEARRSGVGIRLPR